MRLDLFSRMGKFLLGGINYYYTCAYAACGCAYAILLISLDLERPGGTVWFVRGLVFNVI